MFACSHTEDMQSKSSECKSLTAQSPQAHARGVDMTSALCASSRMSSPLWNCCSLTCVTQRFCCWAPSQDLLFAKPARCKSPMDENVEMLRGCIDHFKTHGGSVDMTSALGAESRMSSPLWNCCSQKWLIHWFSSRAPSQGPAFFRF